MKTDRIRKAGFSVFLLLAVPIACAQDSARPTERGSEIELWHTKWIESAMRSVLAIQPGATRRRVLMVFTEEGGLSTRTQRTYVYRQCPYIKVVVKFAEVGNSGGTTEMPEDKITTISRPYLAYGTAD